MIPPGNPWFVFLETAHVPLVNSTTGRDTTYRIRVSDCPAPPNPAPPSLPTRGGSTMQYRFIESREDYSVYHDRDNTPVYFMHREQVFGHDRWTSGAVSPGLDAERGVDAVNAEREAVLINTPDMVDRLAEVVYPSLRYGLNEVVLCGGQANAMWETGYGCFRLVWSEDTLTIDGEPICDDCRESMVDYRTCDRCDNAVTAFYSIGPDWSEDTACLRCVDHHTSYCSTCEHRYWNDDADEHTHGNCSDECESPMQKFSIPLGEGFLSAQSESETRIGDRLSNDEIVTLTVKDNEGELISLDGRQRIEIALMQWGYYDLGEETHGLDRSNRWASIYSAFYANGWEWKNEKGGYTRRLRSTIYKATKAASPEDKGLSVPDDVLAAIGQVAFEFSRPIEMNVAITRDLNQSARDFAHSDSCWWGSYSYSRCALKSNAGFGLRSFDNNGRVTGRAWVFPLTIEGERLVPTFGEADAYIIFNHYGALTERTGVRVLSSLVGWGSTSVDFDVADDEMYVNSGAGTLIASDEVLALLNDGDLRIQQTFERHAELAVPAQPVTQPEPQPEPTQELAFIA